MRRFLLAVIFITGTACSPGGGDGADGAAPDGTGSEMTAPAPVDLPAGTYTLEKSHASLIFRVDHLGFSMYTARFTRFDAELKFDPETPEAMSVTAVIDPASVETDFPDPEKLDFDAELRGPTWLDTSRFPEMTFRSTRVERTGPRKARVTGELSLRGVTRAVTLDVTFNGGYRGHPMDPNARIGFSAVGALKRSEFGIAFGLPPEGTTLGVGDRVEVIIEAEFTGPPLVPEGSGPGDRRR